MIRYCENVVLDSFNPDRDSLINLERRLFKKIPEPFAYIYNINATIKNIKVGPEICMEDFISHNGLFEAFEKVDDYQITIDYLDRFHEFHLRIVRENIIFSLRGADDNWVNTKIEEVRNLIERLNSNDDTYEIEDNGEELFIENPLYEREIEQHQSKPALIMTIIAIISLLIAIGAVGWYFYQLFYWQYSNY